MIKINMGSFIMELVLVDFTNYKKAIEIQNNIFPKEDEYFSFFR